MTSDHPPSRHFDVAKPPKIFQLFFAPTLKFAKSPPLPDSDKQEFVENILNLFSKNPKAPEFAAVNGYIDHAVMREKDKTE